MHDSTELCANAPQSAVNEYVSDKAGSEGRAKVHEHQRSTLITKQNNGPVRLEDDLKKEVNSKW